MTNLHRYLFPQSPILSIISDNYRPSLISL